MIDLLPLIGLPTVLISTIQDSMYELVMNFDYPNLMNNKISKRKENLFAFKFSTVNQSEQEHYKTLKLNVAFFSKEEQPSGKVLCLRDFEIR